MASLEHNKIIAKFQRKLNILSEYQITMVFLTLDSQKNQNKQKQKHTFQAMYTFEWGLTPLVAVFWIRESGNCQEIDL